MNILNRLVTILLLLALLALLLLLAIYPFATVRAAQAALTRVESFLAYLQEVLLPWAFLAVRIGLAVVAVFICGLLLWAEVRPRRVKAVRVRTETGSQATVTADSVARRLAWHIDQLADVVAVTPHVTARGKSVDVALDLETAPEIDVPMKTDEVVGVAREVIGQRMGLTLGKIEVRIKHAPYEEKA